MLTAIKLVHTVIWAILAASIVAVPVAGVLRRFGWADVLTLVILIECSVACPEPSALLQKSAMNSSTVSRSLRM